MRRRLLILLMLLVVAAIAFCFRSDALPRAETAPGPAPEERR